MVRRGLLAAMYEATERHGTSAGDGPTVLGAASTGIVGAGKAACFSDRRDIARRTTGRTSCTLAATDGGMPINMAMKPIRSTGYPVSHGQVMGDSLPTPGACRAGSLLPDVDAPSGGR